MNLFCVRREATPSASYMQYWDTLQTNREPEPWPETPPHPQRAQNVLEIWTTFGPNLALKAPDFFLAYLGGKIFVSAPCPCVNTENAQNFMRDPNVYVCVLTPDLPHPTPEPGCWDRTPGGKFFFSKTRHLFVHNDQCDEGIILGYVCTPAQLPPTTPTPPRAQTMRFSSLRCY